MADAAVALKRRAIEEVLTAAVVKQRTPAHTQAVQPADAPTANPIYKIMFSEETDPEAKRKAVTEFLTFASTKEESKARIKAYQEFEEYLQSVREQMSQEIIRLTDTGAFSELQGVYDELNKALIDFDERMKPLTEIVDAIYTLRTNDKTLEAFKEIQDDRKAEKERKDHLAIKGMELEQLKMEGQRLTQDIADLGEEKAFWGFGGVKEGARKEIAQRELALQGTRERLTALTAELQALENPDKKTDDGEFAAQKAKLRELLDITSDEHKQRQRELVDSALNFVSVAKSRIGSVREHLGMMGGQVEGLYDANSKMSNAYAILSEGIKDAEAANQEIRSKLEPPVGEEGLIDKMTREDKKASIEDYIGALNSRGADTLETYADLTSQKIRIRTMRDANNNQLDKARVMHSQGIAGVADRLSVVLQAVSSAALSESSAMAKDTLQAMVDNTNKIAQKEVIRTAVGITDLNQDVVKAIDDLGAYGEVMKASTDITRAGLAEMRDNLAKIKQLAEEVHADVRDNIAAVADRGGAAPAARDQTTATPSPFFGR